VRLPHVWLEGHVALQDRIGDGYTLLRLSSTENVSSLEKALTARGAPLEILDVPDDAARDVYGVDLILLRPDLHVAWRGNRVPENAAEIAAVATGHWRES
jgi:hypothetical protein